MGGGLAVVASPAGDVRDSYLELIEESAAGGAQALVLLTFWTEAVVILRESLESGRYDQFLLGDALRRGGLAAAVGGGELANVYGTASGPFHGERLGRRLGREFRAAYGRDTEATDAKETSDAAIAVMLAAEAAGSVSRTAIRDELRGVGSAPGELALAGPEGVARAIGIVREGGEIEYEGASSPLDWDEHGDLRRGYIGIWRLTADDEVEDVEAWPYER